MSAKKTIAMVAVSSLLAIGTVAGVAYAQGPSETHSGEGGQGHSQGMGGQGMGGQGHGPRFMQNLDDFDCANLGEVEKISGELDANMAESHELRQQLAAQFGATDEQQAKGDKMFERHQEFKGKMLERLKERCGTS